MTAYDEWKLADPQTGQAVLGVCAGCEDEIYGPFGAEPSKDCPYCRCVVCEDCAKSCEICGRPACSKCLRVIDDLRHCPACV
jgi:hypothetical protein